MADRKKEFYKYSIVATLIAIANLIFRTNAFMGFGIVIIEIIVLVYVAIKKRIANFAAWYIIFVCNCMEFTDLAQDTSFYNLKDIRVGGINLAALLLIPLLLISVLRPLQIGVIRKEEPLFSKFGIGIIKLNTIALIVGALLVLLNDNNIQGISDNIEMVFFKEAYSLFWIPLVSVIAFLQVITYEKNKIHMIQTALQAVIIGCWIQLLFSLALGVRGSYGGLTSTLLVSSISMLFPLFILIATNIKTFIYPKFMMVVCVSGTAVLLMFNSSGKMIIFSVVALILFLLSHAKHASKKSLIILISVTIVSIIGIPMAISSLVQNNLLFKIKYEQAMSMLNFSNANWRTGMLESPRARLEEILDVFLEYINKPWLIITGKGYMGSITDLTGYFSTMVTNGTFVSADEWRNGTYYNLHEIANNLIMFGAIGIKYSIGLIRSTFKQFHNNPWIAIGTIWFLLMFGYSFTLGVYGIFAFMVGLLVSKDNEGMAEKA